YNVTSAAGSWAGSTWTGTILIRPAPPASARWIKIFSPNGFSLLIPLPDSPPASAADPAPVSDSPGERLLIRHAEAILASLPAGLPRPAESPRLTGPARPPGRPAGTDRPPGYAGRFILAEPGFPEVAAILEGAGALSALSPVPRQVAALHTLLGLP